MTMELTNTERAIIETMREYTDGFYKFVIEKKPTPEHPEGELVRLFIEKSELISGFRRKMV